MSRKNEYTVKGIYGYTKQELEATGSYVEPSRFLSIEAMELILRKTEYSGRINILMNRYLGWFERIAYSLLAFCFNEALFPTVILYPVFNVVFKNKLKLKTFMFSSSSRDHMLSVNGRTFYLVGNNEQFGHQFLDERKVLTEKALYLH